MLFNNPIDLVIGEKVQVFDTLRDFYLKVLEILYREFPRGYIDYKVFLYDYTTLRGDSLSACCKFIERSMDESEGLLHQRALDVRRADTRQADRPHPQDVETCHWFLFRP